MILSVDWLRDYVSLPVDLDMSELAHALTLHAVEVEGVERLGSDLADCVFVRVLSSASAGSNDWEVTVDDGSTGPLTLTTRVKLEAGIVTVVRRVPGQQPEIVNPADCGLEVLAKSDGRRGWDVPGLMPSPGAAVAQALGWDDFVVEIDNKSLTNRPDLWCHEGIARELAAIYGVALVSPGPTGPRLDLSAPSELIGAVDGSFCNRFSVMQIRRGGSPQVETPLLIRSRLAKVGQRPINFYTDLTNYVMFATGQPSHAYDARFVSLPFMVRQSVGGALEVLTGSRIKVPHGTPMIADASSELAVAGVVGGRESAVSHQTGDVLVEMASFDARAVRDCSLSLGLRTDASSRNEKALDTQAIDRGRTLFLALVHQYDPEAQVATIEDVTLTPTRPLTVETSLTYLNSRMGTHLTSDEVRGLLTPLGFVVRSDSDDLAVDVPSWRSTGDVGIAADILEEVGRQVGYDELPPGNPSIELRRPSPNPLLVAERRMREFLAFQCQAQEILTYPWVTDRLLELCGFLPSEQVQILGAPSDDRSSLRPSLIPNLLGAVEANLAHRAEFRLFEVGSVYLAAAPDSAGVPPQLSQRLAAAFVGPDLAREFRSAVGAVLGVARAARSTLGLIDSTTPLWGDAVAARDIVDADERVVGHLAARDLAALGSDTRRSIAVCFEFETSALTFGPSRDNSYTPVSPFPTSTFDLSVLVPEATRWSEVRGLIDAANVGHLRSIEFLDEFRGASIDSGEKSITFRLTLGAMDRTLTSLDREAARETCVSALAAKLGARMR